jgi:hypothetical protein
MTHTTPENTTHTLDKATNEILADKKNWQDNGQYLFQNILEGILIEIEEEAATKDKQERNFVDPEMDKEVNQIFKSEKWDSPEEIEENSQQISTNDVYGTI